VDDGGADDYFLDCSVCKKRGLNLDPNSRLVACDNCDRWEHVVCHRKADEKAGRPKRDWDNDPFLCEDCEGLEESVVLPSAPKRERSEKQKAGAKKGAEKRKAKAAADRAKKAATNPKPKPVAVSETVSKLAPASSASPAPNGNKPASPMIISQQQGPSGMHLAQPAQRSPAMQLQAPASASFQQVPPAARSPYHPGGPVHSPSLAPYANMPSPSLQPHPQQYVQQPYQQNQYPGQQMMQQQAISLPQRQPSQGIPSPHYMPQQQQQPPVQYAMQQQPAFPGNTPGYQGNFSTQGVAYSGGPSPQMYAQQGIPHAYAGGLNPMQQQQLQPQGGYQAGYPNFAHAGTPTSAFAQQQMPPGNFGQPQQHRQQQQQNQSYMQAGMGMGGPLQNPSQQRSSQGPQ